MGTLNVSGGTANIENLAETAKPITVTAGTLNLSGTNTIASNSTITSEVGSNLTFKSGSNNTLGTSDTYTNLKGNVTFEKNSTLNVSDTLRIDNGNWTVDGSFVNTKPSTAMPNWQSLQIMGKNTKFTFDENATLSTSEVGSRIWIQDANVVFNSTTGSIVSDSLLLWNSSKLEFNKENSIIRFNGNQNVMLNLTMSSDSTIVLRDTQNFGNILFQGINQDANKGDDITKANTLAKLTLDLQFENANDYVSIDSIYTNKRHADGSAQELNIYVKDFENYRILLTDNGYNNSVSEINFIDAYSGEEIYYTLEATNVNGVNGYWVNVIAIPEPAEWATIFGAIALGFAVYRKRKA